MIGSPYVRLKKDQLGIKKNGIVNWEERSIQCEKGSKKFRCFPQYLLKYFKEAKATCAQIRYS